MEKYHIACINRDRLKSWETILTDNLSTPLAIIAVGHGPNTGNIHIVIPENVPLDQVLDVIKTMLKAQDAGLPLIIRSPST